MADKQRVVFESKTGKVKRASSTRVIDLASLIDNPPADLEQQIKRLNVADTASLLTALLLEVSALRNV